MPRGSRRRWSAVDRDGDALGVREDLFEDGRGHRGADAAVSGVDIDPRQVEDCRLDVDLHALARAEGGGAADVVAGMAVGRVGLAGLDGLDAADAGEVLRRDLLVAVHEADEGLLRLVLEDDRLDCRVVVDAELGRALDRAAVQFEVVGHQLEVGLRRLEGADRLRHRYRLGFHRGYYSMNYDILPSNEDPVLCQQGEAP